MRCRNHRPRSAGAGRRALPHQLPSANLTRRYSVDVTAPLRVTVSCDDVTLALRRHGDAPPTRREAVSSGGRPGGQMGHHQAAVLDRDLELVIREETTGSHPNCLNSTTNFPPRPNSRMTFRWPVFEDDLRLATFAHGPPDTATEIAKALPDPGRRSRGGWGFQVLFGQLCPRADNL